MDSDLKRHIKTKIQYVNPFGDMCVLDIPNDCDLVILAIHDGLSIKPVELLLPHQVYVDVVERLVRNHLAKEVVAYPARSREKISIVGSDVYTADDAYMFLKGTNNE